jgi:hypothetical protein
MDMEAASGRAAGAPRRCRICHEYGHRADNRAFHPQEAAFRAANSAEKRHRSEGSGHDSDSETEHVSNAVVMGRACSVCNRYGHRADNKRIHPDPASDVPVMPHPNVDMLPTSPVIPQLGTDCDPQLRCKDSPHGPSVCAVIQELLAMQIPHLDEDGVLMRQCVLADRHLHLL